MGLFDLPARLLTGIDTWMEPLPPALRVAVWALAGACLSMGLYALVSPQRAIATVGAKAAAARRALNAYDGELAGVWPLVGRSLALAGHRLLLTLAPALVASLPVIATVAWMSTAYGYRVPEAAAAMPSRATPKEFTAVAAKPEWPHAAGALRLRVTDAQGMVQFDATLPQAVPVVEKRQWWNLLFGNPAGYLPADGPVGRVDIAVPRRELFRFGPDWLRTWEFVYFTTLLLCSVAIKMLFRIA